ncbi:MAG: MerR family transcriptional regulator [Schaalia hyovaginalis]|uniref:MerR family transcriptional regulator n=1 Tax=Schaalia hyovaginalis TaxID=29316 RepID=UPI0023F88532|nr:MerR family transcriptional regulator [Schaalia hyovaginalis]MCI7670963.1 MerR family transcriptional regulator [Schaalia hyovaginalis]MDY5506223.1 MerR family transcriptional regulator [Schaalia hyovaginalis]
MHTIGEVSTMFGLPVSTLRYYDQMGLLPEMPRVGGFRRFGPEHIEALRVIECLKGSGLEIKDIKRFMDWCAQGPSTYPERRALFDERLAEVDAKIAELEKVRAMIEFKRWYYGRALAEGNEDFARGIPADLPDDVRENYELAH